MAIPRIRPRWRLRTLMIVVSLCAMGLVIHRILVESAPIYRLMRQLRTGNAQSRAQAAIGLGLMGPKAGLAEWALTAALDDPDPRVRADAALALFRVGSRSRRLIRALVEEIEDAPKTYPKLQRRGFDNGLTEALRAIRPPAALIVPMLAGALKSPDRSVHGQALHILFEVERWSPASSPELDGALLDVLDEPRTDLRRGAAEALAKRDRPAQEQAVARLARDLRDLDSSRAFEASVLLPLFADGTPAAVSALIDRLREEDDDARRLIALVLLSPYGELASPTAPTLLRVISARDADRRVRLDIRRHWWKTLSERGGSSALGPGYPPVPEVVDTSIVALGVRILIGMGESAELRAIAELTAAVRDPAGDDARRRSAIAGLGEFGPVAIEAVPVLLDVIRRRPEFSSRKPSPDAGDDAEWLGQVATEALEKIGAGADPGVISILAGLLEDGDAKVRNAAAMALQRLGPKARSAVPKIVEALERSPDLIVRGWSASALHRIGGPDIRVSLPTLVAALDDENDWVRVCAAQAIGLFGAEAGEAVPKMVRLLRDARLDCRVVGSLRQIGPGAAIAVPSLVAAWDAPGPTDREAIVSALDRIMPRAPAASVAGSIAAMKEGGPDQRLRAAYELGRLIEGTPDPREGVTALAGALGDSAAEVRRMAVAMLAHLGPKAGPAGPRLIVATRDPDDEVRQFVAWSLGRVGEVPGVVPALSDLMKDRSIHVRRQAAEVLGELGPRAAPAVPAMIVAIKAPEPSVRASILAALGRLGVSDGSVVPAIREAIGDPADEVRMAAVNALGELTESRRDEVMPALLEAMGDPSEFVGYRAAAWLGKSAPHRPGLSRLTEALRRGEPRVRRAAPWALEAMSFVITNEPDLRRRAVEALTVALADPDADVRANAASVLRRFGDAAGPAEPALRAALHDSARHVRDNASATLRAISDG